MRTEDRALIRPSFDRSSWVFSTLQPSLRHSVKCLCCTASTSVLGSRRLKTCETATRFPAADWSTWVELGPGGSAEDGSRGDCEHAASMRTDAPIIQALLTLRRDIGRSFLAGM